MEVGARIPQIRKSSNTRRHGAWLMFLSSQKLRDEVQGVIICPIHFLDCRKHYILLIDFGGFAGACAHRSKCELVGR